MDVVASYTTSGMSPKDSMRDAVHLYSTWSRRLVIVGMLLTWLQFSSIPSPSPPGISLHHSVSKATEAMWCGGC